jgi:hypothetical protein
MKLTVEAVEAIVRYCLFKEGEDTTGNVAVEGVIMNIGFHPGRLAEKGEEIRDLLMELPDNFRLKEGSGWSFLNACEDRHGNHWGEHVNVDALLCLGLASGYAKYLMPRKVWPMFPAGMPYFFVSDTQLAEPVQEVKPQEESHG